MIASVGFGTLNVSAKCVDEDPKLICSEWRREQDGRTGNVAKLPRAEQRQRAHVEPVAALHPTIIEELRAFYNLPVLQKVGIFHDKHAVILSDTSATRHIQELETPYTEVVV